ncbi:CBO0543 family protein [Peribacillus butanolivorans]|uniref:CBO0543 family protein n=1 Tax=Peribacillus butanolivorans TaxID=421767 RepID=UPI003D2DACF1
MDFLGVVKGLWVYHVDVLFTIPAYILWDLSVLPVTVMFLLQFQPQVQPFWKALFLAGGSAFVGEPFFNWIGFFEPLKWSPLFSFPIYATAYYLSIRDRFEPLR